MFRKIVMFIALGLAINNLYAQDFGLSLAYAPMRPLNHIIDRYNDTRPWLDEQMPNIRYLPGFTFSFGVSEWDDDVSMELFAWKYQRQTVSSGYGGTGYRKLRVRMTTLSIVGGAWYPVRNDRYKLGLGARPVELSIFKVKGKTQDDAKWQVHFASPAFLFIPLSASSTVFVEYLRRMKDPRSAWKLRLYWQAPWWQGQDMIFVNQALNPGTYNDTWQNQEMGIGNIGLQLLITGGK
ncbi:MAG TPA: hypothetical protein P5228_09790 [Bacteroidales bacterium]|nr:hypothetical protein [Bacteroidales bacterium]HRZ50240.1 hypothetical protein [Bacteroidales bacterium]